MRAGSPAEIGSTEHAGRWLERRSNASPRGMFVKAFLRASQNPAYRLAPLYFLVHLLQVLKFALAEQARVGTSANVPRPD
jgi:hypothetical protein